MKMKIGLWSVVTVIMILSVGNVMSYPDTYVIRSDNVGVDKWFGSHFYLNGLNNEVLTVGGWGDQYITLVKMPVHFKVPGRRLIYSATMYLNSVGSFRPTSMNKYFLTSSWSETSTTDHWSLTVLPPETIPAPDEDGPYGVPITDEFFSWITGQYANNGILLEPEYTDKRFNHFLSSENSRIPLRPRIVVIYEKVPDFKMPLPGGKYWKCSTAAGGSSTHRGKNYYAVDLSFRHYDASNNLIENKQDIPILASADARVIEVGNDPVYDGNYVILDHDKDNKFSTGFQTFYGHMKNNTVTVQQGDIVKTGDVLGIMGTTGQSSTNHLHFQFYFGHAGSTITDGDNVALNFVKIENSWFINELDEGFFYQSSNTHYSF